MAAIKTIGLLGGGVIGAGWAARCALNGYDVVVCDLDPEAERKIGEVMANARRAWSGMTLAPLARPAACGWCAASRRRRQAPTSSRRACRSRKG